ncbi:acetyltransferase, GNAT family [Clostridiales bacterium oral taxon 876 str. F0540]|nr:acetyltransferase, GNAT family [Clostridiales bacterium oral taxon 876 str. F0540]
MIFKFVPMNEGYAREMIDNWKYEGEYSIYNYVNEAELLLEEQSWGANRFAVLDENDELAGELTTEFFREVDKDSEDDGYVDIKTVRDNPDKVYEMWIGFGLKPKLTGKGMGKEFISQCVDFAVRYHDYKGDYVRLGVAEFNKRAIRTYQKAGFEVFDNYVGEIDNKKMSILWMKKSC